MKALIIDDQKHIADILIRDTAGLDVEIHFAATLDEGLRACQVDGGGVDVVLMRDIISGRASCFFIQEFQSTPPAPEILIFTEQGDPQHAEHALESGAWDYVIDPSPEKKLPDMLRRVLRYRHNKHHGFIEKQRKIREQLQDHGIIGSSTAIQNCVNLVAGIAQSDASVLITGETGTGKELFSSAIHNISSRSRKNLTIVDCAALPSTLVESILFGHAKGSFTGADKTQKGLIKQADGGTLFLDEIGEMPLEIQKKFLRVLQERKYLPVGSSVPESSDFRLIAATNRDLEVMVKEGSFRDDLLFRLKTFQLELPPLRIRRTDIAELAYSFRNRYSKGKKLKKKKLSTDFLIMLNSYEWPGNVRELFQAVEHSITDALESTVLEPVHLPLNIRLAVTKKKLEKQKHQPIAFTESTLPEDLSAMPTIKEDRERAIHIQEKQYLETLLRVTGGNIKQCCETASLSRSRLYDLLKKHGLSQNTATLHTKG
ncbi:MAG: sigma-54 dependent transcriptional regulator [Desulforhopalus sp.]